jgi:uncharacterized protein (UPF0147 family)
MNKELYNIIKISFANGDKELQNAKENINKYYDGKIRAIARRAAGFYIDGFVKLTNKDHYGSSFMNHLRGMNNDHKVPREIRKSANLLIMKMTNDELTGQQAINQAEIIKKYCVDELNKLNEDNEK